MPDNISVLLYCVNDGCDVSSQRYEVMEGIPYPNRCPECGGPLSPDRPRSESHRRGPRRYDAY